MLSQGYVQGMQPLYFMGATNSETQAIFFEYQTRFIAIGATFGVQQLPECIIPVSAVWLLIGAPVGDLQQVPKCVVCQQSSLFILL